MTSTKALAPIVKPISHKLVLVAQKLDRLSLRERGLVFGAAVILVYMVWQSQVMDPLVVRAQQVTTRLDEARQKVDTEELTGSAADRDPAVMAVSREKALRDRLAALDEQLGGAAHGYVPPERMTELLGSLLQDKPGLRLVSLRNLPVEDLAKRDHGQNDPEPGKVRVERGPFLHPVEIVFEGDYATIVAYLRELEQLPWRLHWRRIDINTLRYPTNRVRIEIGTLGLSRDWIAV
jgi:MSHA biogenesis protein MshJ